MSKRMHTYTITLISLALSACLTGPKTGSNGQATSAGLASSGMLSIAAPANAGTAAGFNYATQNRIAVDIALSYPNGVVTIYAQRPTSALYDASGAPLSNPVLPSPAVLTQGLSATSPAADGKYHYLTTVAMPADATTVYLATPARVDVPILNHTVTFSFSGAL